MTSAVTRPVADLGKHIEECLRERMTRKITEILRKYLRERMAREGSMGS